MRKPAITIEIYFCYTVLVQRALHYGQFWTRECVFIYGVFNRLLELYHTEKRTCMLIVLQETGLYLSRCLVRPTEI